MKLFQAIKPNCKYGQFCNFIHENRKCENQFYDVKRCNFRHPKHCIYKLKNKKWKFEDICSFKHNVGLVDEGIENVAALANTEMANQIKHLENMLRSQHSEIARLKNLILKSRIYQLDGDDSVGDDSAGDDSVE